MKELTGADRPVSCHGKAVDDERSGLREGIPKIPKLRSRDLKVFGAIEVEYHQFLPGEIQTFPFKGPVVNLHLSAPHRLVQRQNGRRAPGSSPRRTPPSRRRICRVTGAPTLHPRT
jgi:hypothetical protein